MNPHFFAAQDKSCQPTLAPKKSNQMHPARKNMAGRSTCMVKPQGKVECSRMAASGEEGYMDLCELFFQWISHISHGTYPQKIAVADFCFHSGIIPGYLPTLNLGSFWPCDPVAGFVHKLQTAGRCNAVEGCLRFNRLIYIIKDAICSLIGPK